jgi:L-ascorbate metabolism protein UlaG (beta-lactamase superfamily)
MKEPPTWTWLGTAGWLVQVGATRLVIDPFLSRPVGVAPFPVAREALRDATAILCTHGHFDHAMDLEQVARLSTTPVYAPAVICRRLARLGIDPARLRANETATPTRLGDVSLEVVPSAHITYDLPLIAATVRNMWRAGTARELAALALLWPMGSNSDYVLRVQGRSYYVAGSLGQRPAMLRSHRCDVAVLPYNGRSDMPRVTARAVATLCPRLLLLHHWDDFYPGFAPAQDPQAALPALRHQFPGLRVHVAQLGAPFRPDDWLSPAP